MSHYCATIYFLTCLCVHKYVVEFLRVMEYASVGSVLYMEMPRSWPVICHSTIDRREVNISTIVANRHRSKFKNVTSNFLLIVRRKKERESLFISVCLCMYLSVLCLRLF